MWNLSEAQDFVRDLLPLLQKNGWSVAITGSVILNGESKHDLDLVLYPMDNSIIDRQRLYGVLEHSFGMSCKYDIITVHKEWRRKGSYDRKHVEVWETKDGKRVDIFVLS